MKKIIFALYFCMVAMSAMAQTMPPEVEEIKRSGRVVVAMTNFDNLPFYGQIDGKMVGLDVDIAHRVANVLDVKLVFRRDAKTFSDVVEQVRRGDANMAISKLSITAPRSNVVRFSVPYVTLKQALVVNRVWLSQTSNGRETADVIRNFSGSMAFIKGSSYDTFARKIFPNAIYAPEENWQNIVEGVISGKYAAGFRDDFEIKRITSEFAEASLKTKTVTITDTNDQIAAAVHWQSTHLLSIIDQVIKSNFNDIDVKKLIAMHKSITNGAGK